MGRHYTEQVTGSVKSFIVVMAKDPVLEGRYRLVPDASVAPVVVTHGICSQSSIGRLTAK